MNLEIERKFLVNLTHWNPRLAETYLDIEQGYLAETTTSVIRVRTKGSKGYLTVKENTATIQRLELEYEIPLKDARYLLSTCCSNTLSKRRYFVPYGKHVWEVDVFNNKWEGLILAEIELGSKDESFELPEWIGKEVSDDSNYYNVNLAKA